MCTSETRDRRIDASTTHETNDHRLVAVTESMPGDEPTDTSIELHDDHAYLTRYWRCRNCGQERNRPAEFSEPCAEPTPATPLSDGGYSIDDGRTRRALTEQMETRFGERGPEYVVDSESDTTYTVNVATRTCSCLDYQKRAPEDGCKHLRRVDLEIRAGQLPRPNGRFVRTRR